MNIVKISQKQVESLKDYLKKRMQPMLWVTNALNTTAYDKIDGQDCIDYWRSKHPGRDDKTCRFTKRNAVGNDIIVGGHVISVYVKEPKVYITPILKSVNSGNDRQIFAVDIDDLARVPKEQEEAILRDPDNVMLVYSLKRKAKQWL